MGKLYKDISARLQFAKELYIWGWRWVVLVVWGIPYGLGGLYDFLRGEKFNRFGAYPALGSILPDWLPTVWFIGGLIAFGLVTFEGAHRIVQKERNKRLKPIPLQDRGKLIRTIYDAKISAIELIDCKRKLAESYEKTPYNIDKDKAAEALKKLQVKYDDAVRLLDCEKLVAGYEYEPVINSLMMAMNLGTIFWNSTTSGGRDFLPTFKSMLEANVRKAIENIDELNQQAIGKKDSQID